MPPIYEYQCNKCNLTKELLLGLHDDPDYEVLCDSCKKPIKRIISASKGYVKGTDNPCKN